MKKLFLIEIICSNDDLNETRFDVLSLSNDKLYWINEVVDLRLKLI